MLLMKISPERVDHIVDRLGFNLLLLLKVLVVLLAAFIVERLLYRLLRRIS